MWSEFQKWSGTLNPHRALATRRPRGGLGGPRAARRGERGLGEPKREAEAGEPPRDGKVLDA